MCQKSKIIYFKRKVALLFCYYAYMYAYIIILYASFDGNLQAVLWLLLLYLLHFGWVGIC